MTDLGENLKRLELQEELNLQELKLGRLYMAIEDKVDQIKAIRNEIRSITPIEGPTVKRRSIPV